MFQDSFFLALPVAVFVGGAFVVLFLAFRQTYVELGAAFMPVEIQRYEGVSFALNRTRQPIELVSMQ